MIRNIPREALEAAYEVSQAAWILDALECADKMKTPIFAMDGNHLYVCDVGEFYEIKVDAAYLPPLEEPWMDPWGSDR